MHWSSWSLSIPYAPYSFSYSSYISPKNNAPGLSNPSTYSHFHSQSHSHFLPFPPPSSAANSSTLNPTSLTPAHFHNLLPDFPTTLEPQFRNFYDLIHRGHLDFSVLFSVTFVDDFVQPPDSLPQSRVEMVLNAVVGPTSLESLPSGQG